MTVDGQNREYALLSRECEVEEIPFHDIIKICLEEFQGILEEEKRRQAMVGGQDKEDWTYYHDFAS